MIMGCKPCIRDMRITVGTVVRLVASGTSFEEILQLYPYLESQDIRAAVAYAAWGSEERDHVEGSLPVDFGAPRRCGPHPAGLGGCAKRSARLRDYGMEMTYTWTIAWRPNGLPIENVGVIPYVPYTYTVNDLRQHGYGYAHALLTTILQHLS